MLHRFTLPQLFVIAALVVMALTAGAVWQFPGGPETLLRALVPAWVGIAAVFWVLWRQIAPPDDDASYPDLLPQPLTKDFTPLRLEIRYSDIASLPIGNLEFVIFDTETTGLGAKRDDIVQIGAVRIVNGRLLEGDTFERMVNPGQPVPKDSKRFHGITDEMVAHAPGIEEMLTEFLDYAGDAVLVGHNIAFDLSLINRADNAHNPSLDTMLLSIAAFPARRDHTLDSLSKHFDEIVEDRHSALHNADLTARIFLKLLPEIGRAGATTFGDTQDLCAHAADKIRDLRPNE